MKKDSFVARFTPSLLSAETLEAIFVKREKLAARLVDLIRESALTDNKHYVLLVGPRGMGKTHLVSLVYHRVMADEQVTDRLAVAWLREEEWGVSSFLDLLLRILRALHEEQGDKELAARCERLRTLSAEQAELEAENLLKRTVGKRTLLLIAENLDEIFNGLGEEGQERLRAYIQNNPFFTILATSQSLFGGVSLRTSPFYAFFETQHLEQLGFEDAVSLVAKIAENEGNEELASAVRTPRGRARIRAVHHLAGGNPRVYVIFSQLLTVESLDQLVDPVLETLDGLTPYYQSRMNYLSPQQQKLVQFLCDRRGAVPVNQIARSNFLTPQTASSQLRKLNELGYVRSHQIGRESYYELREPLMRLSFEVKKTRSGPVRLLVEFVRVWYSHRELAHMVCLLPVEAAREREYLLAAIEGAKKEPQDATLSACWRDWRAYAEARDWQGMLKAAEDMVAVRGNAFDWSTYGLSLAALGRNKQASAAFEKAMNDSSGCAYAFSARALALTLSGHYEKALASASKATDLGQDNPLYASVRAIVLSCRRRHEEALPWWEKAMALAPDDATILSARGEALFHLDRHGEALDSFEKSLAIQDLEPGASLFRAGSLMRVGRWTEGAAELDEALRCHNDALRSEPALLAHLLYNVPAHTNDRTTWERHISLWIDLFRKHRLVVQLAIALAFGIGAIPVLGIPDHVARSWCEVWRELAEGDTDMAPSVFLLTSAVEYRASRDERILMELPTELREFLRSHLQE